MKSTFAYISASILTFFAPVAGIMIAVGAFISLDTLLGMMAAHKLGEKIESKKLSRPTEADSIATGADRSDQPDRGARPEAER